MNNERITSNVISLIGFILGSTLWIYFFSKLGINLGSVTDFSLIPSLLTQQEITNLILMVLFFALAIVSLIFDSFKRQITDKTGVAIVGVIITYLLTIGIFTNAFQFNIMMLTYLVAAIITAAITKHERQGRGEKFKIGKAAAKKTVLVLAIGAGVLTYMIVSANLPQYQNKMKSDIISMAGNINISSMTQGPTQGILKQQVEKQLDQMTNYNYVSSQYPSPNMDDIKKQVIAYYQNNPDFAKLPQVQQQQLIDNSTKSSYDKAIAQREAAIQKTIKDANVTGAAREQKINQLMQEAQSQLSNMDMSSEEMQKQLQDKFDDVINSMPIIQTIMDALPIANAIGNFTAILFIGNILLSPTSGLLAILLLRSPKKPGEYENEKQKQQQELKTIEQHAAHMKELQDKQ